MLRPLTRHPATPSDAVSAIEAEATRPGPGRLALAYRASRGAGGLAIPPLAAPARTDGLWKHTCFEAFLVSDDSPGYYELNFSPSGEWAAYRFCAYRTGMTPADGVGVPTTRVAREAAALRVEVTIAVSAIQEARHTRTPLRITPVAVIEDIEGRVSYWAQRHPPGKPDFHHPDGLALEISP